MKTIIAGVFNSVVIFLAGWLLVPIFFLHDEGLVVGLIAAAIFATLFTIGGITIPSAARNERALAFLEKHRILFSAVRILGTAYVIALFTGVVGDRLLTRILIVITFVLGNVLLFGSIAGFFLWLFRVGELGILDVVQTLLFAIILFAVRQFLSWTTRKPKKQRRTA